MMCLHFDSTTEICVSLSICMASKAEQNSAEQNNLGWRTNQYHVVALGTKIVIGINLSLIFNDFLQAKKECFPISA